jgi:protease IV
MAFLKKAWRILVAFKDGMVLLFMLLFFALIFSALASSPNPAQVSDGALLIKLDGVVAEQPADIDPIQALIANEAPIKQYKQRDIIRALDLAVSDDSVKAVVFDLDRFLGGGQASLSAIGDRIDAVKKSGKPVYSFATAYSDDGYQIASHATQIWMDPMGGVLVTGPGGAQPYIKGLLDKIGITAHVYKVGTYKSAVEPFIRSEQSPEAKEALKAVYDEIWGQWRADVAKARPAAVLDGMLTDPAGTIEAAKGNLSNVAIANKLVDKLGDRVAFGKFMASKYGEAAKEKTGGYASIPMNSLLAANGEDSSGEAIGVITVAGEIIDGKAGAGSAAGTTVSDLIYDALDNKDLKALVVRVDSPGGSVLASEKIRLAIEAAKAKKLPVVVSMANLAASGGYWISTPADTIFAEPSTITGSIGIFGILPSGEIALRKIGVNADGVKTTPLAGEPNILGGVSPEFDRFAQSTIEKGYDDFLTRVANSRKKTKEQVDAIGQGRIWAGGTARQIGLVDRFGGMDDALAEAARLAKLDKGDWHAEYIEPKKGWLSQMFAAPDTDQEESVTAPMDLFARAAWNQQLLLRQVEADLQMITSVQGAQVRCLECGAISGASVMSPRSADTGGWAATFAKWAAQ